LIDVVKKKVIDRLDSRKDIKNIDSIAEKIALGALRFQILKQAPGKNVMFDVDMATSFEGDSGPYLQYTAVRAASVLEKALQSKIKVKMQPSLDGLEVLRYIAEFPAVTERAADEYAPQQLVNYLLKLASEFNSYYAKNIIFDKENEETTSHRLAITDQLYRTMCQGLLLVNIDVPDKM
jgi:arginyl-tRNA synthetase